MRTPNMTLEDKAKLVSEMLPGHTLDFKGKVVPCPICPLCRQGLDYFAPYHDMEINGKMVRVHQICPAGTG